jgi:hypothetical protein
MLKLEKKRFNEVTNPEEYVYFSTKYCTCLKIWEIIGVEKHGIQIDNLLKRFKEKKPATPKADDLVSFYSTNKGF